MKCCATWETLSQSISSQSVSPNVLLCHTVHLSVSPSTQYNFFYLECVFEFFFICVKHSLTHSHYFCYVFGGSVSVGRCALFCFWDKQAAE